MPKATDIRVREISLYFLPVTHRVPLKFGAQTVHGCVCARVRVVVEDRNGRTATGWGETPLSVAWVWPSTLTWTEREERMKALCSRIARDLVAFGEIGHPIELCERFGYPLDKARHAEDLGHAEPLPHLAAIVCLSPFDLAIHDAFATLLARPVFACLGEEHLTTDLAHFLDDEALHHLRPDHFLREKQTRLPVWHLVGGLDPLDPADLTGSEPADGYPFLLRDWIRADGLRCLKIKLRGNDSAWDFDRILRIGQIAIEEGCHWLTADFNCTVTDPAYVCDILDRLLADQPRIYGMILYIEQPFPYDLREDCIDVHSVSARKPLFLDESASDWMDISFGYELGWTGVALKTCKTLTGSLLSLAWARHHGMTLMVQDLTNPMLAQIPHLLLAAHAGTIMGVESNGMQFCPAASEPEARIHPGIYRRREGILDISTLGPTGFGYRVEEIARQLPEPALVV